MNAFNFIARELFAGLLVAIGWLGPGGSLALLSLLLGVAMLVVFKFVGDPRAMALAKRKMQAHLMELRLYDKEPTILARAFGRLMLWNWRYFAAHLKPAVVATIPMVVLLVQMDHYYGVEPLAPGESAVVTAKGDSRSLEGAQLQGPEGVRVETPGVRVPSDGEVSWRIRGEQDGEWTLSLVSDGKVHEKSVTVASAPALVSIRRVQSPWDAFLHPMEPRLEGSAWDWVEVRYPARMVEFLGMEAHWLVWLLVISLLGAFAIRAAVNAVFPDML